MQLNEFQTTVCDTTRVSHLLNSMTMAINFLASHQKMMKLTMTMAIKAAASAAAASMAVSTVSAKAETTTTTTTIRERIYTLYTAVIYVLYLHLVGVVECVVFVMLTKMITL